MKKASVRIRLYGILLGLSISGLVYILLKPDFTLSSGSKYFFSFLSFLFLTISFCLGLIVSFKEIDRGGNSN